METILRIVSQTTWKEDIQRAFACLKAEGTAAADRSFAQLELMKLRRRLDEIDEKLALAFQSLGKKSLDHWTHQQRLDAKEKNKAFVTIDTLKKEREKVTEMITALKTQAEHESSAPRS